MGEFRKKENSNRLSFYTSNPSSNTSLKKIELKYNIFGCRKNFYVDTFVFQDLPEAGGTGCQAEIQTVVSHLTGRQILFYNYYFRLLLEHVPMSL